MVTRSIIGRTLVLATLMVSVGVFWQAATVLSSSKKPSALAQATAGAPVAAVPAIPPIRVVYPGPAAANPALPKPNNPATPIAATPQSAGPGPTIAPSPAASASASLAAAPVAAVPRAAPVAAAAVSTPPAPAPAASVVASAGPTPPAPVPAAPVVASAGPTPPATAAPTAVPPSAPPPPAQATAAGAAVPDPSPAESTVPSPATAPRSTPAAREPVRTASLGATPGLPDEPAPSQPQPRSPPHKIRPGQPSQASAGLGRRSGGININRASADELDHLAGGGRIGQTIASHRPYRSLEDLVTKRVLRRSVFERIKRQLATE